MSFATYLNGQSNLLNQILIATFLFPVVFLAKLPVDSSVRELEVSTQREKGQAWDRERHDRGFAHNVQSFFSQTKLTEVARVKLPSSSIVQLQVLTTQFLL